MNHYRWTKTLSIGEEPGGVDKGRTRGIAPKTNRPTYGGAKPTPQCAGINRQVVVNERVIR